MTRFAALCYAITAAAAAIGTTAFQPPSALLLPTVRHHEALVRFSSTHDSITTHNNHNDGQYQLEQKTWMFQDKYPIAYEVASAAATNSNEDDVTAVPILLLNGFGVGSFHQHRLMRQLLIEQQNKQSDKRYVIYGIDYLGQGKSWPADPQDGNSADEYQLGYSADMWLDQLASFVQEVVISPATDNDDDSTTISASNSINNNNKVHLVGNSVGGYLATILTHKHPQLISSLTLLNATPVWGLNLPGWDGKLPAPAVPKAIGRQMFNLIRNEDVIRQYLEAAYVRGEAFDGTFEDGFDGWGCIASNADKNGAATAGRGEPLGAKIRACTEGNGGHAAFASILWSAPASGISFYEALQQVPVDVLLLFGGDDPWCTEAVGKRMHVTLASRRDGAACRFVTLKNAGHCPNHEAPTAVAQVLMPWLDADDSEERRVVPLDSVSQIQEPWGEVVIREVSIEESESLGLVDRVVSSMVG